MTENDKFLESMDDDERKWFEGILASNGNVMLQGGVPPLPDDTEQPYARLENHEPVIFMADQEFESPALKGVQKDKLAIARARVEPDVSDEDDEDEVEAPSHYTRCKPEPIDVIARWRLTFNRGNVVKYLVRAGYKDDTEELKDLRKALQYLQHEIRVVEGDID